MHLTMIIQFLEKTDELKTARTLLDTFSKYANSIEQYDELAMLYEKIKSYDKSIEMLRKLQTFHLNPPQIRSVYSNFAKVYNHLNDPFKSIEYTNLLLELNSKDHSILMEQSFSYYLLGEYEKSYDIQLKLINDPDVSSDIKKKITFNMGTFDMKKGNFKTGLYKMIMGGKEIGLWNSLAKPYHRWKGEQTDKTILIYAEAGMGDEIIDIRFTKEIEKRGMKYLWVGHRKETNELFRTNGYNVISTNDKLDPLQEYVYCESMSLPVLLDLNENELWQGAYLKPKQEYIEKWKKLLPEKFMTVRWSGNPYYDHDLHRSLDSEKLISKIKNEYPNIPLVYLQVDDKHDELINVDIKDWDDTLAIQHLALVNITSCTSTAHSAGSIGTNCIVMPPICYYYLWCNLRDDYTSHWYGPNLKAFKQTKHKDWSKPYELMIEEVKKVVEKSC